MEITAEHARQALLNQGYDVSQITRIPEGSNHYVFDVVLGGGGKAICKFPKVRYTERELVKDSIDTLFGGKLSLKREAFLYSLVRDCGLPAPEVYGRHCSPHGNFIVVEKMPGASFRRYLQKQNYSERAFLDTMEKLGRDFAKLHQLSFPSFGNVMAGNQIDPEGVTNFSRRYAGVLQMHLNMADAKGTFAPGELAEVEQFFSVKLKELEEVLEIENSPAVLVITDFHADNFFVDDNGTPCGYFDLESCQAAPAALEFYGLHFFLFNYFDAEAYHKSQKAFYASYAQAQGPYRPSSAQDFAVIDFLAACRLLEMAQSYWGYVDGLRDTWGQRIKDLLWDYMESGRLDYLALGAIWRERDGQPPVPSRP